MKKHLLTLLLCFLSTCALCQQRGHFLLGGNTSVIFGAGTTDNPSTLFYTLEAGISYDILERLRLCGTLGGFRSVMSFSNEGWMAETANGPMVRLGADYLFSMPWKHLRPSASLSAGYRLRIPPVADARASRPDGAFLQAAIGTDFLVGGLCLNLSLKGELTGQLNPAAGLSLTVFMP